MNEFIWIVIILIFLGIAFVFLSVLGEFFSLEEIPNWLVFIYSSDGFHFVTSPILILLSAIILIFKCLMN